MVASLPTIRSALLSAKDQLRDLLDQERGRRPNANMTILHALLSSSACIAAALSHVDGLDASLHGGARDNRS